MNEKNRINLQRIIGQTRASVDREREQQVSAQSYSPEAEGFAAGAAGTEEVYSEEAGADVAQSWSSNPDYSGYQTSPYPSSTPSRTTSAMSTTKNVLSSDVEIKGSLKFSNDLVIDGHIEGEVTSDNGSLTVGENAYIKGEIKTQRVTIFGKVEGNVTVSERCEIKANSEVLGDIAATTLTMEEGAIFSGQSRVGRAAATSGSGKTAPAASHAAAATA